MHGVDAMPNPNVAPIEPQPEPQPQGETANELAGLEQHIQTMLDRFEVAAAQPESPERSSELEGVAGEYALGSLEAILKDKDGGLIEALLIKHGARTKDDSWILESPLFTFLAGELARTLPVRLDGLRKGQYRDRSGRLSDQQVFRDGIRKHLRSLVRSYTPPRDARKDRRQPQPPTASAAA